MKLKKKVLSLLLTTAMMLTMLPFGSITALAASTPDSNQFDLADGSITISAGTGGSIQVTYGLSVKDGIAFSDPITIECTNASTSNTVLVDSNLADPIKITLAGVNISSDDCAFSIGTGTIVNLTLSGSNSLSSGYNDAGLQVSEGAALTITESGTGSLAASGGGSGAGIGGGYEGTGGTITIEAGTVTATGGMSGAGIGGGYDGEGGTITINGGNIHATAGGGGGGAGIGGGNDGTGGTITINGGLVTAVSEDFGAGIGGGMYAAGGEITIKSGTVIATGGESGAGIGGGRYGAGGTINIKGGSVTATSSDNNDGVNGGAGIGGGNTQVPAERSPSAMERLGPPATRAEPASAVEGTATAARLT